MSKREVTVKTLKLHEDQVRARDVLTQYFALRCGRRWGKSAFLQKLAVHDIIAGKSVAYFAPDYRRLLEFYNEIAATLLPITTSSSKMDKVIRTDAGQIEFWSLNDVTAGRGRRYHTVLIDEAAFTKDDTMMQIWEGAIKPTLFDFSGRCIIASNTNGDDPKNFFWKICNDKTFGFGPPQPDGTFGFHAPTRNNPCLPIRRGGETDADYAERRATELQRLIEENHPLVYEQEYLAEFVNWAGVAFFDLEKMFVEGKPIATPKRVDAVLVTIDTATKTGKEHDGTAVIYWGYNKLGDGPPLAILDWDIIQIEGSLLEAWLPIVFETAEAYATQCRSRSGFIGAWIEDKSSGMVLLQHAQRKGWRAFPIDSKLTSMGKSERAVSVSGYNYRGEIKITQPAHDKTKRYKDSERNHLIGQVLGFRIDDKNAATREDDLLDCFCYGPAIALGNQEGF